jgi:ClpP class serine protease
MLYLLKPDVLDAICQVDPASLTVEQRLAYENQYAKAAGGSSSLAGDTAEIVVDGVLTPKPDLLAKLFGGGNTAYSSIIEALRNARTNSSVKRVILQISSPGGDVDGLFETLDEIAAFKASGKQIIARASMACSAAYAIAAATGRIEAVGEASRFGSIGVATERFVSDRFVSIASTGAPNKRPDVRTEAGKNVVRAELDEIHDLFVRRIAAGRGVPVAKVAADYGKGSSFMSAEAKRRGMIDSIGTAGSGSSVTDDLAIAQLLVQKLEAAGRGSAGAEDARQMDHEARAKYVSDIVCGRLQGDRSEVTSAPTRNAPEMASDERAQHVADIVCRNFRGSRDGDVRIAAVTDGRRVPLEGRKL